MPELREAYTSQCTTKPGKGMCQHKTCLQCQLHLGEEWNPIVASAAADVPGMLQQAGAQKQSFDVDVRETLEFEWPEVAGRVAELKMELENTTYKTVTNWGHPCISQQGFKWDLKTVGAYPCMYKIKINGEPVYRSRIRWDARNDVYTKFLTADQWYQLPQQNFGPESKGDLIEFLCFFGAAGPHYPKTFEYAKPRVWMGVYRWMTHLSMEGALKLRTVRVRADASPCWKRTRTQRAEEMASTGPQAGTKRKQTQKAQSEASVFNLFPGPDSGAPKGPTLAFEVRARLRGGLRQ